MTDRENRPVDPLPDVASSQSTTTHQVAERSLADRVGGGAAWLMAARLVMRVFGFINTIIVARLLAPEDFGIVAIGVMAMQLLQGFSDIGVSQAVVKFRDAGRDDLDTLFTLSAIRGVGIALLMAVAAPLAGVFYDDPRVVGVFLGAALYPLLTGFINPRFYEFERNLDFSKEFIALIITKLAGVIVSIAIAVIFRTYWAIILGLATNAAVQLALSYLMQPHLPRLSLKSFEKVIGFSGWITGVSFMAALNNKLDSLIVARVLGADDAGNYYVGHQLAELPTTELAFPMSRAIYPGLSELQGSKERMRQAFLSGVEALGAVAMPAGFGFAFVAPDLIHVLLGAKWDDTVPVVQWLTPVMALQMLFLATQYYAMAEGRTKLVFVREFIFFLVRTPAFIIGAIAYGFIGAILAAALSGLVHVGLNLALYSRLSGGNPLEPLWRARRSFVATGAMAAWFFLLKPIMPQIIEADPIYRLILDIIMGGVFYVTAHFAAWRLEGAPAGAESHLIRVGVGAIRKLRKA